MAAKFELNKGRTGKFSFNLKAGNGQLLVTSPSYDNKRAATAGISAVKKNAVKEGAYERKSSSKKEPYFVIKATNAQVIGKSRMYANPASMDQGIKSVMKNAPDAPTLDLTTEAPKAKAAPKKTASTERKVSAKTVGAKKAAAKKAPAKTKAPTKTKTKTKAAATKKKAKK